MADVLSQLPALTWRGLLPPPYDVLEVSWENGLAPRRIPYVDGDIHDAVGRSSFPMTARLYFLKTVEGGSANFPGLWNQWKDQLLDGNPGDLVHPLLGEIRARVKGAKFSIVASCRSGIVVDVTWLETVEDPSELNLNGFGNTTLPSAALAAAADQALAAYASSLAVPDPSLTFGFQMPTALLNVQFNLGLTLSFGLSISVSIASVFNALLPILFAADSTSYQALTALMGGVATLITAVEAHDDVFAYSASDALIEFYLACDNMRQGALTSARPTSTLLVTTATTLDAVQRIPVVAQTNTLTDLMGLNLPLLLQPRIAGGSAVTYYTAI